MNEADGPMQRAQAAMRTVLPKRFYKEASAGETAGGFSLLLDGKQATTPAKRNLVLPSRTFADAVTAEWNAVGEFIDPSLLP